MKNGHGFEKQAAIPPVTKMAIDNTPHPAWRAFIRYCAELGHGEIEKVKIQEGLPVMAEVTRQKIRFTP